MGFNKRHRAEWPSKKRLYELYWGEDYTTAEIGDKIGRCTDTVLKIMRQYGIPRLCSHVTSSADTYADAWAQSDIPTSGGGATERCELMDTSSREKIISLLEAGYDVATVAEECGTVEKWVRKVQYREGMAARELNNQEKTLDPTIKSTETPDEMVDDTLSIGVNGGSGGYSQR